MNLKKVLSIEPKNKAAKAKYDEICIKMKSQMNVKKLTKNIKLKRNSLKMTLTKNLSSKTLKK